jgi:hypothetical protein
MRPCIVFLLCLIACSHSEPYALTGYRETGPRLPGPEALIAGGQGVAWTQDGAGLIYPGTCYGHPPFINRHRFPPEIGTVAGMALIPATGGSVSWERCELGFNFITTTDSNVSFPTAAMSTGGRLLYVELIGLRSHGADPDHYPVFYHADLYLSDSGQQLNIRRKLSTLFREQNGHATVPPTAINQLEQLAWVGTTSFIAESFNLTPDGNRQPLGLALGSITSDSAVMSIIPGTAAARRWSVAEGGATVIFVNDSLTLRREAITGGAVTVAATIPTGARRFIADVSCRDDLCLVLTLDDAVFPRRISKFWTVSLPSGTVTLLRTDQQTYTSAKLSPGANLVLVGESDGFYLFSELLH